MSYITSVYYNNEYEGVSIGDSNELTRLIKRSSEIIDLLTGYKVKKSKNGIEDFHHFVQDQIKLATSIMTEHYILNGGYEAVESSNNLSNVSVGSFSYTLNASNGKKVDVPEKAIIVLSSTGLLYAGIDCDDGSSIGYDSY